MLTHLQLTNFKIWRTTGPIRLAPLTLLLGTNSSGKSSLIQSLLLIRQTAKGDDPNLDLNLGNPDNGDSVTLGQFKDVLCRHGASTPSNPANQVGIEFRWSADGDLSQSTLFSARYREGTGGGAELDYLRLGSDGQGFIVERRKPGIYRLQFAEQRDSVGQSADYRPQKSFSLSKSAISRLGEHGVHLARIGPMLLEELNRIIYVGPVRKAAQRHYIWSGSMPERIDDDGGNAIDALIAGYWATRRADERGEPMPPEADLFKQTEYWLQQLGLADGLEIQQRRGPTRYELLLRNFGELSNVKDVGVGVSRVLPVIVAALFARPGNIVIVEEPESHLHPLAQAELGNLFVDVSKKRNVQFIVETHSEYLFRRTQTLIAREEASATDAAMYFVEREGKDAKLISLEVDEFGRVKWPDGFFGNALGETREQARLMFERLKGGE